MLTAGQTALLLSQASTWLRRQIHRTGWQVFKTSSFGDKHQDDALKMTRSRYNLEILKKRVICRGARLYLHIWHMTHYEWILVRSWDQTQLNSSKFWQDNTMQGLLSSPNSKCNIVSLTINTTTQIELIGYNHLLYWTPFVNSFFLLLLNSDSHYSILYFFIFHCFKFFL